MPAPPSLPYRLGLRLGAAFDRAMDFYVFRLAVNLAYKLLLLAIATTFPGAIITGGLWYLGFSTYYAAAFGGAIGVMLLIAFFPDKSLIVQLLTGLPPRHRR